MSLLTEHTGVHGSDTARNQIEAVSVPLITSIGISVATPVIPIMNRVSFKLSSIGVSADYGTIPMKNYFKEKIVTIGVSVDKAEDGMLWYQIN